MGDPEGTAPPSKKRFASGQLSRDNPGLDDDGPEPEMGTFQRASDDVLATRKIVKVRRLQPPGASAAESNPFAGLSFAAKTDSDAKTTAGTQPPPSAESHVQPTTEQTQPPNQEAQKVDDDSQLKPDKSDEEKETENATKANEVSGSEDDGQNGRPDDNKQLANKTGSEKDDMVKETSCSVETDQEVENGKLEAELETRTSTEDVGIEIKNKDREEGVPEVGDESGEQKEAVQEVKDKGGEQKEAVLGVRDENEEQTVDSDQKGKSESVSPLKSFQQLSSSQNAFSGLAGTGFAGTSFSFGSIATEGSSFGTGSGILSEVNNNKPSYPSFNTGSVNPGAPLNLFGTAPPDATKSGGGSIAALQEVPVETGEENEKVVFNADAIVFEYLDGSWKERGKGDVKVNVASSGDSRARLVMRAKGNYRLILNANLFPDMSLTNMEKRGVTFACVNSTGEGKGGLATFALKFKDASIVEEFRRAVTAHKGKKSPSVLKTPENSPKASGGD